MRVVRAALRQVRENPGLWAVVGVALALRLLSASLSDVRPVSDEEGYHRLAMRWLATDHFADTYRFIGEPRDGLMVAWRTPGYPVFLATLYRLGLWWRGVAVVQAGLGALAAALVYLIALRLGGRRAALAAGLPFALSVTSTLWAGRLASETVAVTVFAGSLLALVSRRPGWAGLLLGAGVLVRPALVLCVPAFVVVAFWQERSWRVAAVCGAAAALMVVPWVARNVAVGVGPVLSTTDGYNLYVGNNPLATSGGWNALSGRVVLLRALPEAEMNRTFRREAVAWIRAHPVAYLRLCGRRLAALYGLGADGCFPQWQRPLRAVRWLAAPAVLVALAWGLWQWRTQYALLLPLLAYSLGLALTFADERMREPLGPIVCALLGLTGAYALERYRPMKGPPTQAIKAKRRRVRRRRPSAAGRRSRAWVWPSTGG